MNPFLLSKKERLDEWRNLRETNKSLSEAEQLENLTKWISQAPLVNYVLDFYKPDTWNNPWELMNTGDFDQTAKMHLLFQTMLMIGWDESRLTLEYIKNNEESFETMILIVDNFTIINYYHNSITNKNEVTYSKLIEYKYDNEKYIEQ